MKSCLIVLIFILAVLKGKSQDTIVVYGTVLSIMGEDTQVYEIPDTICNGFLMYYDKYDSVLALSGRYENCKKEGFWIEYWNGNKRKIILYRNGVSVNFLYLYPSGKKNIQGPFINENLEEVVYYYYESGTIRQIEYLTDRSTTIKFEHFNEKGELTSTDKHPDLEMW